MPSNCDETTWQHILETEKPTGSEKFKGFSSNSEWYDDGPLGKA
jgi:hypothetical protein